MSDQKYPQTPYLSIIINKQQKTPAVWRGFHIFAFYCIK